MPETHKRQSLLKSLYKFRHVGIPLLVYSCELTVWAVLNRHGIGDYGWQAWRIAILACVFILVFTSAAFNKNDAWGKAAWGVIAPWLVMLLVFIVYGFIRMSLDFVTIDMFFIGVFASGACPLLVAAVNSQLK